MAVSSADPVACALVATLSNHASERQSAESLLSQLAQQDDHATHLLQLAAGFDPIVAPAAALRLKNLLRTSRVSTSALSETARAGVRQHILSALSAARASAVEGILAETMRWLVLLDFPSRWPTLLQEVSNFLSSGDAARVHAALLSLRQLVKCYEFKSRDPSKLVLTDANDAGLAHPRQPLESIATVCFPTLLALYRHLDGLVSKPVDGREDRDHAARAQRLVVKIFWSCTHFILPPCLAESNALDGWMTAFFTTMRRSCAPVTVDDPEDLSAVPEWKTKKWIAQVLVRFLKRYGAPKKIPVDEPWACTIAESFKVQYAELATSVMLDVLSAIATGQQLSRRVAHLALDFIEEAIETAQLWAVVKTRVDMLLTQVVFSYLCFSDADEELWMNDPGEYVRKQYDFTEDLTSPRMGASNLLTKMADLRSKSTILPFLHHIMQAVLEPYSAAVIGSPERVALARQKVGAFASLAAVKMKLVSKKDLGASLLSVLKSHVEPDLQSEFGFLRSESAWLLGQIASCGWKDFSKEIGERALRGCVALLQDPDVPVQASAAGALQYLMDQEGASTLIEPVAPQLLERLLQLMDSMSDGYASLLPAVDKLVERYPDKIMPVAMPLVRKLMTAFQQSSEGILKDGGDEDDDLVFTAAQVLHLVASVLSSVGEWEQASKAERGRMFGCLEKELEPWLSSMFDESHQVFVEELLDVLGIMIAQTGEVDKRLSPFLLSLIPKMAKGFDEWAADYVEQMMDAIEGYLSFGMADICAGSADGLYCFIGMIEKLWSDKYDDSDAMYGAKIGEWMIMNLSKIETISNSGRREIVVRVGRGAAERLVKCEEDAETLIDRLYCVVMDCCHVDAEGMLKSLGTQSLMQLIGSQTANLKRFDRMYTKKSGILGLCGILCTRGLVMEESKPHLVRIIVELQKKLEEQRSEGVSIADMNGMDAQKLAKWKKEGNGFSSFELSSKDDVASDLEDDEDATSMFDEIGERQHVELQRLAGGTGLPVGTLQRLSASNGNALETALFDFDDIGDEEDEELMGVGGNVLDEIDEAAHVVRCVKMSAVDSWWQNVSQHDRSVLEALARRVDARSSNGRS